MIKVSWTQLKQIINNSTNTGYAWFQDDNSYTVFAVSGAIQFTSIIAIGVPAAPDQTDFENNYKTTTNNAPITAISPKPYIDNSMTGTFNGNGQTIVINTVGCSTVQYGSV